MTSKSNIHIHHALNGGGKELTKKSKTYKIDWFCGKENTVYKYYGCFWHGCQTCYLWVRDSYIIIEGLCK